jgi:transposase
VIVVAEASDNRGGGRHDMLDQEDVGAMKLLWRKGWRIKQIVRDLGHGKNTVRRYLRAFEKGLDAPPTRAPNGRPRGLGGVSPDWLKERLVRHGGNADVVRQDLAGELGIVTSLRTVERAVAPFRQEIRAEALATVRFETPPGKQISESTKRRRRLRQYGLKRRDQPYCQSPTTSRSQGRARGVVSSKATRQSTSTAMPTASPTR